MQVELNKTVIPVGAAAGLAWLVASMVYSAGGKVSATTNDIEQLTAKVSDISHCTREDHDTLVELKTKLQTLKEYVDSVEASKNITISMADDGKKGAK